MQFALRPEFSSSGLQHTECFRDTALFLRTSCRRRASSSSFSSAGTTGAGGGVDISAACAEPGRAALSPAAGSELISGRY